MLMTGLVIWVSLSGKVKSVNIEATTEINLIIFWLV